MRHRNLLLGAFLLTIAGIATSVGAAAPARQAGVDARRARSGRCHTEARRARSGRCHMDAFSWFIISGRRLIRRDARAILYGLSIRAGESGHRGGHYPNNARGVRIAWERVPKAFFVFCSSKLPTVMNRNGNALEASMI